MKWYEDPEYHLMCEGAEEIQKEKIEIDFGDYYAWHDSNRATLHTNLAIKKIGTTFWLPSQEDLQEMVVKITTSDSLNQAILLYKWIGENILYANGFNDSLTKLWLAFVMHELYQKKWNPESKEWEKTK